MYIHVGEQDLGSTFSNCYINSSRLEVDIPSMLSERLKSIPHTYVQKYSWIANDPAKRASHSGRALDMELGGYKGSSEIPK